MPIVNIHLMEGRSVEQKRELVDKVTKAVCESINVAPEQVRIILSDMSKNDFSIAGKLIADK
jgi:4-oxalocrotonate tautomerase